MKALSDIPDDWPSAGDPGHQPAEADAGDRPRKERPSYRVFADLFQYRIVSFEDGRCVLGRLCLSADPDDVEDPDDFGCIVGVEAQQPVSEPKTVMR